MKHETWRPADSVPSVDEHGNVQQSTRSVTVGDRDKQKVGDIQPHVALALVDFEVLRKICQTHSGPMTQRTAHPSAHQRAVHKMTTSTHRLPPTLFNIACQKMTMRERKSDRAQQTPGNKAHVVLTKQITAVFYMTGRCRWSARFQQSIERC